MHGDTKREDFIIETREEGKEIPLGNFIIQAGKGIWRISYSTFEHFHHSLYGPYPTINSYLSLNLYIYFKAQFL